MPVATADPTDDFIAQLDAAIDASERAALAIGRNLELIVKLATAGGADGTAADRAAGELSFAKRIEAVTALSAAFADMTRAFLGRQKEFIQNASQSFKQMYQCSGEITDLVFKSHMLALNMQIESARLGGKATAFHVIGMEMTQFSTDVRAANGTIVKAMDALAEALPKLESETVEMGDRVGEFADRLGGHMAGVQADMTDLGQRQVDSRKAEKERNQRIVRLANRTLSELQFQDPMAQDLQDVIRYLDGRPTDTRLGQQLAAVQAADHDRAAGDVDLF